MIVSARMVAAFLIEARLSIGSGRDASNCWRSDALRSEIRRLLLVERRGRLKGSLLSVALAWAAPRVGASGGGKFHRYRTSPIPRIANASAAVSRSTPYTFGAIRPHHIPPLSFWFTRCSKNSTTRVRVVTSPVPNSYFRNG
jgi:hypothetical protein